MQWTKDSIEICWTHFRAFSEISFVLPPAMAVYCLSFTLNSTADFSICKVAIGFIKIRWSFNFFSIWKWKKTFPLFLVFYQPKFDTWLYPLDIIQSFLAISLEISDSKFCIFKCNIHLKCDKRHVNHSETLHRTT